MTEPSPIRRILTRTSLITIRRFWAQLGLSLAVVALASRVSSVTDSRGSEPPAGVSLELSGSYIAISPVSRILDSLSLLSNAQSIAVFASVGVILGAYLIITRDLLRPPAWRRIAMWIGGLVIAIAAVEAAVILAPRPMAALRVDDPEVVTIDFHSHTGASHDVRKSFTAEDNREWHRSGGFDVAYISDHVKFDGVVAARPLNPVRAGDGTSLLSAVEGRYHRIMSTIMLGLTEADAGLLNRRGNLLPGARASGRAPVTIIAIPNRNLDSIGVHLLDSLPNLAGIELIDAAPRGLAQLDREEAKIRRIAAELELMLVAASNNHGWGRTVAAWNLMRIPGWRSLSPDSVGRLIEQPFRDRQLAAATIVIRARPRVHGVAVVSTLPILGYQILGSLTFTERLVWLAWIWGITAIVWVSRRRRRARR